MLPKTPSDDDDLGNNSSNLTENSGVGLVGCKGLSGNARIGP